MTPREQVRSQADSLSPKIAEVADQVVSRIIALLPAVNDVIAAHRVSGCENCAVTGQDICPPLNLAAAVLGVIVPCWSVLVASRDVVYDVVAGERRGVADGYGHRVILRVLRFSREETRWPRRTV
jgi:hypothetical protein